MQLSFLPKARCAPPMSCARPAYLSRHPVFVPSGCDMHCPAGKQSDADRDLENFKLRLKALEAKVAEDGIILTEAQVQALEKKKHDDEACGRSRLRTLVIWALRIRSMWVR